MSFNVPITSPQLAALRTPSEQGTSNVSFYSNRVVFAAQVNVALDLVTNYASFTWASATVGAYTDVEVGQTILVSETNDITQAQWRLRVRLAPGAHDMYVNETDAKIPTLSYFWVIDTFEVWDRLSRPDTSTPPVQFIDFDEAYETLLPSITGLKYQYAGVNGGNGSAGKLRITLNLVGVAMESGATISSMAVTPRSGQATLISGSYTGTTSISVVFDLDPSTMATWGETWFVVTCTDSNGVTLTRHSGVKITDDSHPPDVGFENLDITDDVDRGWTARLPAFEGVDDIFPWTLCVVWRSEEAYGGTVEALGATSNIDFVGYLIKDSPQLQGDANYAVVSQTTFELSDVAARLSNIEMQLIAMFDDVVVAWDHINNLTVRRGIWHVLTRHSTVAFLVDVSFDLQLTDDSFLFPFLSTQGQNSLAVCNGIAAQVNAALEFGPDGAIEVNRDARFLSADQRDLLNTIATFQATGDVNDDCTVISSQRTYEPRIGVVDANGVMSDPSGNPSVFQSRAPGMAQGMAQGTYTLANQILVQSQTASVAQNELNQRGGNAYEVQNSQETLTLEFPDGYNLFVASRQQWYVLNIAATVVGPNGVGRIIYDTSVRWLLTQVHYVIDPAGGSRVPQCTFTIETPIGDIGYTVQIPPQASASPLPFSFVPPAFPALTLQPVLPAEGIDTPPPMALPTNAGVAPQTLEWSGTQDSAAASYASLTSPLWADKTPSDLGLYIVQQVIADLADLSKSTVPAYLLANDGTNSAVWYTPNIALAVPVWTKGADVSGVFSIIRLSETPGTVMIYSVGASGSAAVTYDFTVNDQGWTNILYSSLGHTNTPDQSGSYVASTGWEQTATVSGGLKFQSVLVGKSISPLTITRMKATFNRATGIDIGSVLVEVFGDLSLAGGFSQVSSDPGPEGIGATFEWSGPPTTVDRIAFNTNVGSATDPTDPGGTCTLTKIELFTTTTGDSHVAVSTDFGATFASPVDVGTTPGTVGGFDVQHGGTASFAAADQEIYKATTLGGAYSTFLAVSSAEPICILLPWYKWGSAVTKNTGSTPDLAYGSNAAVGGETFWLVVGSTATACSPSISGTKGLIVGANAISTWKGTRIAGLFSFSGTVHLMTGVITNTGTPAITWTDRGALSASYIRGLYQTSNPGPLFIAGPGGSWYSGDYGVNVHSRTGALTAPLGVEPCG